MQVGSKELIRDINNNIVLETIIEYEPISRAELSKKLGLTKATISSIVKDLLKQELIVEVGIGRADIGRRPILLKFNQKAGYSICIDLGVETISIMLTDLKGRKKAIKIIDIPEINKDNVCPILIPLIDDMIKKTKPSRYGLVGITIGIHGVVYDNDVIFTPYYNLKGANLASQLEEHYGIPVYLLNEANLSVLGEKTFAINAENMANINIHWGIGVGLVINNKLYEGYNGFAGEFGHTIIEADGKPCPCGNKGCIEQYASERALLKKLSTMKNKKGITFNEFMTLYEKKDKYALIIMDDFIKYISIALNNILTAFNPEIIIINSKFTNQFPEILENIKGSLHSNVSHGKDILISTLENSSILYGAAYVNIINFLGIKYYNPKIS